jgi:acetyl esterase/lipase
MSRKNESGNIRKKVGEYNMKSLVSILMLAFFILPVIASAIPVTVNIWDGLAPGETKTDPGTITADHSGNVARMTDVFRPQMMIYGLDDKKAHPAVLVFPGGGYSILAVDLEGSEIAQWLNTLGFVAAVLDYRVPDNREGAFQDAQRAMSVLRSDAHKYGINPKEIGVIGFSAGGHLAARLSCNYAKRAYPIKGKIDKTSCRPDFAMLVYPAYLIDGQTGEPTPDVIPHAGMCPVFLAQTMDDPYLDAPAYAKFLDKAGVKTKLVTFDKGGHGYGLRLPADMPAHEWSKDAADWLRQDLRLGKR